MDLNGTRFVLLRLLRHRGGFQFFGYAFCLNSGLEARWSWTIGKKFKALSKVLQILFVALRSKSRSCAPAFGREEVTPRCFSRPRLKSGRHD
jgi:hypothetical protein